MSLSGTRSSFQKKGNVALHMGNKALESGGAQNPRSFRCSDDVSLGLIMSKDNIPIYQEIVEHAMLPFIDKLNADTGVFHRIAVFDWPANWAEMNLLENPPDPTMQMS